MWNIVKEKIFKSKRLMKFGFFVTLVLFTVIVVLCVLRGVFGRS